MWWLSIDFRIISGYGKLRWTCRNQYVYRYLWFFFLLETRSYKLETTWMTEKSTSMLLYIHICIFFSHQEFQNLNHSSICWKLQNNFTLKGTIFSSSETTIKGLGKRKREDLKRNIKLVMSRIKNISVNAIFNFFVKATVHPKHIKIFKIF